MIWEDNLVGGEWLGKKLLEEPIYVCAKVYGVAEDEGLCDLCSGCDGRWNEPRDIKKSGAGGGVAEELREITDMGVVDGEAIPNVAARVKAEGNHDLIECLTTGKCCTDGDPGDR